MKLQPRPIITWLQLRDGDGCFECYDPMQGDLQVIFWEHFAFFQGLRGAIDASIMEQVRSYLRSYGITQAYWHTNGKIRGFKVETHERGDELGICGKGGFGGICRRCHQPISEDLPTDLPAVRGQKRQG